MLFILGIIVGLTIRKWRTTEGKNLEKVLEKYFDISDLTASDGLPEDSLLLLENYTDKNREYFTEEGLDSFINRLSAKRFMISEGRNIDICKISIFKRQDDKEYHQYKFAVDLFILPAVGEPFPVTVEGGVQFEKGKISSLKFYNLMKIVS